MKDASQETLAGKLLIAMPGVHDPHFERSVVYICAHSHTGAMGLVVNKRADGLGMHAFLDDLSISKQGVGDRPVYLGGPVQPQRGFVLHSPEYSVADDTMVVNRAFAMTASKRVLEDLGHNEGPNRWLTCLGYSGWGEGQLEEEIMQNAWLTLTPGPSLVFSDKDDTKWNDALNLLGVSPQMLSGVAGHA